MSSKELRSGRRRAGALTGIIAALAIGGGATALTTVDSLRAQTALTPPPITDNGTMPSSLADVVEHVGPAVVNIQVEKHASAPGMAGTPFPEGVPEFFKRFFDEDMRRRFGLEDDRRGPAQPRERRMMGVGSGFIIAPEGFIVTNHHVVTDADEITVTMQDGETYDAELVGSDAKTDLALLKVESDEPLPYVEFGNSEKARVGDWVIAVGNPFGLGHSVTAGIISARGRTIGAGPYDDFLQISAPINQGNSGGPTFNIEGKVIGVNTAIYSPSGGSVGIGFAIPASLAQDVITQLRETGEVERGWLGVVIQNVTDDLAAGLNLPEAQGAIISEVTPDSPAAKAGLRQGDVILAVNGEKIDRMRQLPLVIANIEAGSTADMEIWRNGERQSLEVEIGLMPDTQQMASAETGGSGGDAATEDALGLKLARLDDRARERFGIEEGVQGVLVTDIAEDSPASGKGISPGDVILSVENEQVSSPADVVAKVEKAKRENRKAVLMLVSSREAQQRFVALPIRNA